ncbi:MAG TPA: nucleotide sugar dehydrogenase [Bacteroidales bacterium]|jgi:UDP-N-acetyl-D-galactosamine dehydrogenase|nr:nucleotide sugar dehydrogenase [Bacteroidales bacterium]HHW58901.1 nucleotide sugar dehydrogenase [Bacteroidales bacterium]
MISEELKSKRESLGVIGLGYVGLPIALAFAKCVHVIGYDIKPDRVELLKKHVDPSNELPSEAFDNCDIDFTNNYEDLHNASFYIITVPTPVDKHNFPDLSLLIKASETIGKVIKKGDYVVYESTVYPGATEEDCIPVIENISGLRAGIDFKYGYSPERINPGDPNHTLSNTIKVVSACDKESLEQITTIYSWVVEAGIHQAPTIKVAEAAKIIENTQRDINIALMNELSIIFNKMNINTYDVLEAASTKWNFLKFEPGLVGGHCIGVDPYYLLHKAYEYHYLSQVIMPGRRVNDAMGYYVAEQTAKMLIATGKNILETNVLVLGVTFKENVSDIRNTRIIDMISELKTYGINVDAVDYMADAKEFYKEYGYQLKDIPGNNYDAVILAVKHKNYEKLTEDDLTQLLRNDGKGIVVDIKGILRGKINKFKYWTL